MLHNKIYNHITNHINNKLDIPTELKHALIKSDIGKQRMKVFANNMAKQISSEKNSYLIDEIRLRVLVESFTDQFIYAFKRHADDKAMSQIAADAIVKEKTKYDFLDNDGNGLDPETGIKVIDKDVPRGTN